MIDDVTLEIVAELSPTDWLVGFDEVGRGSWAGPLVVGAAAIQVASLEKFFEDNFKRFVDDSKRISRRARDSADLLIRKYFRVGIGSVSHFEIDSFGLAKGLTEGAKRALSSLGLDGAHSLLLLDGKYDYLEAGDSKVVTIVGGDRKSAVIASASVVAKVFRDRVMVDLDDEYPFWNFASNVGYPSPRHRASIGIFGLSAIHRRSWSFARPFLDCATIPPLEIFEDAQMILFEQNL